MNAVTAITRAHRWIGVVLALFWMVQAVSGMSIAFRWELDDAALAAPAVAADPIALGHALDTMRREGLEVSSMWASGGDPGRFDIFYARDGEDRVARVDGKGRVIRDRGDELFAHGGVWDTLTRVHQNWALGDFGSWLVGISGIFLLVSLLLGIRLAWPRRWHAADWLARPRGPARARITGWHRRVGLWWSLPAVLIVSTGIMLVFVDAIESGFDAALEVPATAAADPPATDVGSATVLRTALTLFPGSTISGFNVPNSTTAPYRVRVNVPGETRRIYGATTLYVTQDGKLLLAHDARESSGVRALIETLYPLHTGQIAGAGGRWMLFLTGAWLLLMITLGIRMFWQKRSDSRAVAAAAD